MDTLLHLVLSNAILATLLALLVAAIRPLCRRPALLHSLWLLVLLKLVTPSFLSVPMPPLGPAEPPSVPAPPMAPVPAIMPVADLIVPAPPEESPAAAESRSTCSWKEALVAVWLTGLVLSWGVAAYRIRRFRQLLRVAEQPSAELQEQVRRIAARLGLTRCPQVCLVPAPLSPLLWALGRTPCLLLPAVLWQRLSQEQRETLLAHELAHLRRRDHWIRRLELLVLGIYWWHPVAWWARRELREVEEQCCDAWVVWALPEAAAAYAAALVETVAFLSQNRSALPIAASGVGHAQTLKRRVTMILRDRPPRSLSGMGFAALLALAALLLPLLPSWGQPAPAEEPVEPPIVREAPKAASAPKARPPQTTPAERERAEQIEQARDEIELLEAKLEVNRARVLAVQASLLPARERLARLNALHTSGAVEPQILDEARAQVASLEAQLRVNEAELREPEARLRQASRRLASLLGESPQPARPQSKQPLIPKAAPEGGKVQELEKKLDALQDAVNAMRDQLHRQKPAAETRNVPADVTISRLREFKIPVQVNKDEKIKHVFLYVSTNRGKSWRVAAAGPVTMKSFPFNAPTDGEYWFAVGVGEPGSESRPPERLQPSLRVLVDTVEK